MPKLESSESIQIHELSEEIKRLKEAVRSLEEAVRLLRSVIPQLPPPDDDIPF